MKLNYYTEEKEEKKEEEERDAEFTAKNLSLITQIQST